MTLAPNNSLELCCLYRCQMCRSCNSNWLASLPSRSEASCACAGEKQRRLMNKAPTTMVHLREARVCEITRLLLTVEWLEKSPGESYEMAACLHLDSQQLQHMTHAQARRDGKSARADQSPMQANYFAISSDKGSSAQLGLLSSSPSSPLLISPRYYLFTTLAPSFYWRSPASFGRHLQFGRQPLKAGAALRLSSLWN